MLFLHLRNVFDYISQQSEEELEATKYLSWRVRLDKPSS